MTADKVDDLITLLNNKGPALKNKKVIVGFDGFIETSVNVVKNKGKSGAALHFKEIREFGDYIIEKKGSSFSLEIIETEYTLAGSIPFVTKCLNQMGLQVHCIGPWGYETMCETSTRSLQYFNHHAASSSTNLNFNNGQINLLLHTQSKESEWSQIKKNAQSKNLFCDSDLLYIVCDNITTETLNTWQGVFTEIIKADTLKNKPLVYFDLSGLNHIQENLILRFVHQLKIFSNYTHTTISITASVGHTLCKSFNDYEALKAHRDAAKVLLEEVNMHCLILASKNKTLVIDENEEHEVETLYTAEQCYVLNSVFAVGQLLTLDIHACVLLIRAIITLQGENAYGNHTIQDVIDYFNDKKLSYK